MHQAEQVQAFSKTNKGTQFLQHNENRILNMIQGE